MSKSKFGFTLAEVLITLGVVAIVAVLTVPNLMIETRNAQFKSAYKKSYNMATVAWKDVLSDGVATQRTGGWCDNAANAANFQVFKSYFIINKDCGLANAITAGCWANGGDTFDSAPNTSLYSFVDASGVDWAGGEAVCGAIVMDVNGKTLPNKFGQDRFALIMGTNTTQVDIDRITPWADITATDADKCKTAPCYYSSWLFNE